MWRAPRNDPRHAGMGCHLITSFFRAAGCARRAPALIQERLGLCEAHLSGSGLSPCSALSAPEHGANTTAVSFVVFSVQAASTLTFSTTQRVYVSVCASDSPALTFHIRWRQGPRGFTVGFLPCILRSVPANAAAFTAYELMMRAPPQKL